MHETLRGHKIIAVSARRAVRKKHRMVTLASRTATVRAGTKTRLEVKLGGAGKRLLGARRRLKATLTVTQERGGERPVIARRKVTFKAARRHRGR